MSQDVNYPRVGLNSGALAQIKSTPAQNSHGNKGYNLQRQSCDLDLNAIFYGYQNIQCLQMPNAKCL